MRDIDAIIKELTRVHPELTVAHLKVLHPDADDDGVWFFRHPCSPYEVQLESPSGASPFLFETDAHAASVVVDTVAQAISLVADGLGLGVPAA
ncbi:hypothetical protein [Lysobacter sp. CA199]|uniref:hypothetical protein n=1 Tax=Lysobacter sp. CA199 TaxID=3455608 RepID=UPI003F8D013D